MTAGAPRDTDDVHNDFHGEAHGPVVQAGIIEGGVNFHSAPQFAAIVLLAAAVRSRGISLDGCGNSKA